MSGKREIETIIEQGLGEKNSSRLPFLDALGKKGGVLKKVVIQF